MAKEWSVGLLLGVSSGYWRGCALQAAVRLKIFTVLGDGASNAAQVADVVGSDVRATGLLLDALAAMGLLVKTADRYANSPFAMQSLVASKPGYMGHIILHHHHILDGWAQLDQAVMTGSKVARRSYGAEIERESFLLGMFNLAMGLAPQMAANFDLTGRTRLLDLGGGPGTYAIHFCRENPKLTALVFDLPSTRPFAEQTIARFGLADRITFAAGDFTTDKIPGRFDAAWLSHILHGEGPAGCAAILAKAVAALEPGGLLMVQEFILDDTRDGPLFPALFSLNMLLGTPGGQAYSHAELVAMLDAAGVGEILRLPLELPNGAGILVGTVPGKR